MLTKIKTVFIIATVLFCVPSSGRKSENKDDFIISLTMCAAQMSLMNGDYTMRESEITLPARSTHRAKRDVSTECPVSGILYRTADGFCNNIKRPNEGRSFERFKRYIKPAYQDGQSAPRTQGSCYGGGYSVTCYRPDLPSARTVSQFVHSERDRSSWNSIMLMQWGQFLDHDLTASAIEQPPVSNPCCQEHQVLADQCFPIRFNELLKDRYFKTSCMEFVRSRPITDEIDLDNPREQQNLLTAFVDASNVYGSTQEGQDLLRAPGGRMKVSRGNLLPKGRPEDCILDNAPYCFAAGDERVHVFPGLTALHTLFVRLHNDIVDKLAFYTYYDDETLFQETRKIVSALMQKITYLEFLPELLSQRTLRKYGLKPGYYKYDDRIDPSIFNAFATAVFRFGHTLIPDFLVIKGKKVLTRDLFNNPQFMFTDLSDVVKGILSNPGQMMDRFLSSEVTDRLFERGNLSFDIASLNIQRGRDHGLPPYNDFREHCHLPRLTSFYSRTFRRAARVLRWVYRSVDDIDLFAGMLAEEPLPGASLGPTASCLLAQQFHDLKYGDSFWYETRDLQRGFTREQLRSINRVTFSQLLCEYMDLPSIQRNPFRVTSYGNSLRPCSSYRKLDLRPWYFSHKK